MSLPQTLPLHPDTLLDVACGLASRADVVLLTRNALRLLPETNLNSCDAEATLIRSDVWTLLEHVADLLTLARLRRDEVGVPYARLALRLVPLHQALGDYSLAIDEERRHRSRVRP